jgi:hypothetical protein
MTRAATRKRPEIDCSLLGNSLFWPSYRLLDADEFPAFPADIGSAQKNAVHM